MNEPYTLRQAAQLLGVSLPTLRRRVTRGEIPARMTPGPFGDRWEIEREYILNLLEAGEALQNQEDEAPDEAGEEGDEALHESRVSTDEALHPIVGRPPVKRLHGAEALHGFADQPRHEREAPDSEWVKRVEALHEETSEAGESPSSFGEAVHEGSSGQVISSPSLIKALDMLQEAQQSARESLEEARRFERQSLALQYELHHYRRALSENAQSVTEKQALVERVERQAAEAQQLEEANIEQAQQFKKEKTELCDKLKLSDRRVEWLEQRVPRWVRRVFGA